MHLRKLFFITVLTVAAATIADAQFYQMSNGSYMTGYGQVHGSFGYAMATQNMYNTMQTTIQMSMNCRSMEKQFGRPKTLQAEPKCKYYLKGANTGTASNSTTRSSASNSKSEADYRPPAPKYYGKFRPDRSVNMAATISETLFESAEDRAQLRQVIEVIQASFDKEAKAKGWNNNFAAGMTFFLVAMSTVYHDSPEPDDATTQAIYDAVNEAIDAVPDFASASNKDKHSLNDMLVGFSALPFATYIEAKSNGDAATLQTARALAGEMIKLVLKTDPENVRFDQGGLTISK